MAVIPVDTAVAVVVVAAVIIEAEVVVPVLVPAETIAQIPTKTEKGRFVRLTPTETVLLISPLCFILSLFRCCPFSELSIFIRFVKKKQEKQEDL